MIAQELADRIHADKKDWPQWLDSEIDDRAVLTQVQHQGRYDDEPVVSPYISGGAQIRDLIRYEFDDGSALVTDGYGMWDVEGSIPFSMAGAGDEQSETVKPFFVTWEIDIDASSPEEAARKALKIQRDPESVATVFDVFDGDGRSTATRVDLDEI